MMMGQVNMARALDLPGEHLHLGDKLETTDKEPNAFLVITLVDLTNLDVVQGIFVLVVSDHRDLGDVAVVVCSFNLYFTGSDAAGKEEEFVGRQREFEGGLGMVTRPVGRFIFPLCTFAQIDVVGNGEVDWSIVIYMLERDKMSLGKRFQTVACKPPCVFHQTSRRPLP